jgi:hypothetical protein
MAEAYIVSDDDSERVKWPSNAINRTDIKPGDHIYCIRGVYSHHGIYVGEPGCEIIHLAGSQNDARISAKMSSESKKRAHIQSCTLEEFTKPSSSLSSSPQSIANSESDDDVTDIRLVCYNATGWFKIVRPLSNECAHKIKSMPPNEVVEVAKYFLQHPEEYMPYRLLANNCETFACFCKTGRVDLAKQAKGPKLLPEPKELCRDADEAIALYRCRAKRVKTNLNPGDHIVNTFLGFIMQHGIYLGEEDCEVITVMYEWQGYASVFSCTLENFGIIGKVRLIVYGISTTVKNKWSRRCREIQSMPPKEIVKVAKYFLEHPGTAFVHGCLDSEERFAEFCKTGRFNNKQSISCSAVEAIAKLSKKLAT